MSANDQGADPLAIAGRWQVVPRTLCFVINADDILLLKRGMQRRVYPGHYNGVGGHIERGEDPLSGAIREIHEETGLTVQNVRFCGSTIIDAGQATGILLFIFTAEATNRDFIDSDEGTLQWLPIKQVLDNIQTGENALPLVEDLPIILPRILHGEGLPFFAHVSYDAQDQMQFRLADL